MAVDGRPTHAPEDGVSGYGQLSSAAICGRPNDIHDHRCLEHHAEATMQRVPANGPRPYRVSQLIGRSKAVDGRPMHGLEDGISEMHQLSSAAICRRLNCEASLRCRIGRCEGEAMIMDVVRSSERCNERVLAQTKDTLREIVRLTAIHGLGSSKEHR